MERAGVGSGRPTMVNGKPYPPVSGRQHVEEAADNPGQRLQAIGAVRTIRSTACDAAYCGPVVDMLIVRRCWRRSRDRRGRARWRIESKAEPTSKVSASATSVTTRIERVLFWRNPVPERPPASPSTSMSVGLRALQGRDQPKINPVAKRDGEREGGTRQSMPTSTPSWPIRGRPAVLTDSSARMPACRMRGQARRRSATEQCSRSAPG